MILLSVPYAEKDKAKSLGARWDSLKKAWYVPEGQLLTPFERWLPQFEQAPKASRPKRRQRRVRGSVRTSP